MGGAKLFFIVLTVTAGVVAAILCGLHTASLVLAIIDFLLLVWMYFSVVKSDSVVRRGMELLGGQEFNNRLAKVGEPGADRIVVLFNRLLESLSEERLRVREQNHFLDLLIEVSPIGVAVMDFDGRIDLVNSEFRRITGLPDGYEPKGKSPRELPGEIMEHASTIGQGETQTFRIGDTQIFRCSRLSFMERGFRKPFILIERLTDEVRKAEKAAYGKIIRTISHEVNNSIGGVNTFLEVLASEESLDDDMREVADSCRERMDSLGRFIRGYADIVKLPPPSKQVVELNGMIEGMRPFLDNMASGKVDIEYELSGGEISVKADKGQFEQVVVNIVKNAVESVYARAMECAGYRGHIVVRILSEKGSELQIDDNGQGIRADDSENIFTPFFTTRKSGQGIGLTLASEVLNAHGWRFSLRTLADGITRFSIKFS